MATNVSEHPHARPRGRGEQVPSRTLRDRLSTPWVAEVLWMLLAMAGGGAVAFFILHLWDLPVHVPLGSTGDGLLNVAAIKSVIEHGWYFTNHSLGAPFGAEQYDFSALDGDNLQFAGIKVLSLASSDPAAVLNMYYLLSYPVVAGAGYLGMRALGISRSVSACLGVVFTALSYHFERGPGHLFLGDYFAVPGACWLVLRTLTGAPILQAREGVEGWRRWLAPRTAAVALVVLAAGASTLYYAVFSIMLIGAAALLRGVAMRSWRAVLPGAGATIAIGLVLLVNLSPALVYQHRHGRDTEVARRSPIESELYSTSLTYFLLPNSGHPIRALSDLAIKHESQTLAPGERIGQSGGFLAAAGFVGLLVLLAVRALRGPPATPSPRYALAGAAAVAAAVAFLIATFGGISELVAYLISPQIRAWNRMTPFLVFFSLVAVALVFDRARGWLIARRGVRVGGALAIAALALIAYLGVRDQTEKSYTPSYPAISGPWGDQGRFVAAIERSLPRSSMILQLPLHTYPETGRVNEMGDYDELIGYVHSRNLRWSYGAMEGRPQDWVSAAASRPLPEVLKAAVAAGFAGVYIDRAAYTDHGTRVESVVRRTLGKDAATVGTDDGRLVFYNAAPLAAKEQALSADQRQRMADALIYPTGLTFGDGTYTAETTSEGQPFRWIGANGALNVTNPGVAPRELVLTATAKAAPGAVTFTPPGGPPTKIAFTHGAAKIRIPFTAPVGTSHISFRATTPNQAVPPDTRDLRVQLFGAAVTSPTDSRSNQP